MKAAQFDAVEREVLCRRQATTMVGPAHMDESYDSSTLLLDLVLTREKSASFPAGTWQLSFIRMSMSMVRRHKSALWSEEESW